MSSTRITARNLPHLSKQFKITHKAWKRAVVVQDHARDVIHLDPTSEPPYDALASGLGVREDDHFVSPGAKPRCQGVDVELDAADRRKEKVTEHEHAVFRRHLGDARRWGRVLDVAHRAQRVRT